MHEEQCEERPSVPWSLGAGVALIFQLSSPSGAGFGGGGCPGSSLGRGEGSEDLQCLPDSDGVSSTQIVVNCCFV